MRAYRTLLLVLPFSTLLACGKEDDAPEETDAPFIVRMPSGAPAIPVVPGNEPTVARVTLGKALFFDEGMSLGNGIACASCHFDANAFSDTIARSEGAEHRTGLRNAPSLTNVAYLPSLFRDGGIPTLEQQVLAPVHSEEEMASDILEAAALLGANQEYAALSRLGYGRELDPFVITRAIACYERTLISGWSRYDRFLYDGDESALTEEEHRGYDLFVGPSTGCANCHSGFDLSDHTFRNVGLTLDHSEDAGRERITLNSADRGKFKVPTLRNVAVTGPYMHDGSIATLEAVVEHFAGGGVADPIKDPLLHPLTLTAQDKSDLVAFLRSLTDDRSLDQVP